MSQPTDNSNTPSQPMTDSQIQAMRAQQRQEIAQLRAEQFAKVKNYTAIAFLFASPVLIALPPRKLDLYTASLVGAFYLSADHLTTERTGVSIGGHITAKIFPSSAPAIFKDLPSERAEEIQAQLRAAREAQLRDPNTSTEEVEKLKKRQQQHRGVLERIWMGNETEGWKERRLAEEQKALSEGKGYWDLICDYIWDVWSWGNDDEKNAEN
ncbi:hypothetical protein KEM55_008664 [Ascosphaera atra]|nr:hypothetical protein KEM55_008664 [Ascosphaera atra]